MTKTIPFRPNTKKAAVFSMLKRGTTVEKISKKLEVSSSAAQSLINDVKRAPFVTVVRVETEKGNLYKAS